MPHLWSASVDYAPCSTGSYDATKVFRPRFSHAASAIELRGPPYLESAPSRFCQRKGGRHARCSATSLPLGDITHNARRSPSKSESSGVLEPFPSLNSSECDDCNHNLQTAQAAEAYPSPPTSESGDFAPPMIDSYSSQDADPLPFPLSPAPLSSPNSTAVIDQMHSARTPCRRRLCAQHYLTPPTTPDRFISSRFRPQEASKTFRISKSPHQLSSSERLLRHPSATPDPFGPLIIQRRREAPNISFTNRDNQALRVRTRTMGLTNVLALPQDTLALQNRQASAGAVWNVGGSSAATQSGPIRSVSNGRGGFLSSGSNAPMFTSHFFDDDIDHSMERMESRLAAALDIDLTSRVLGNPRESPTPRSASTSSVGVKRKIPDVEPRPRWAHGVWTRGESRSRE